MDILFIVVFIYQIDFLQNLDAGHFKKFLIIYE
jgi:hypothetical protein